MEFVFDGIAHLQKLTVRQIMAERDSSSMHCRQVTDDVVCRAFNDQQCTCVSYDGRQKIADAAADAVNAGEDRLRAICTRSTERKPRDRLISHLSSSVNPSYSAHRDLDNGGVDVKSRRDENCRYHMQLL